MLIGLTFVFATLQNYVYFFRLLRKVTFKIVVITAFFVVCVSPFSVAFLVTGLAESRLEMGSMYFGTQALALLNSALQPLLVCSMSGSIRKELIKLVCACRK